MMRVRRSFRGSCLARLWRSLPCGHGSTGTPASAWNGPPAWRREMDREYRKEESKRAKPAHRSSTALPVGLATGIVASIDQGNDTLLRSEHAMIRVRWFKDTLPPGVKIGAIVTVYGKLVTFNNGRMFQLIDSVVLELPPVKAAKA